MKDELDGISLDSLRECFELIGSRPDERLIRKYVSEERGQNANPRLTSRERRWIEANLSCNPVWQEAYHAASSKSPVRQRPSKLLQIAVAVAILIAGPLWMDSLYVSRGPSEEALRDVLEIDREVVRGSYSEPVHIPRAQEQVLPLTLNSLVDVKPLRYDTTNVSLLKRDLIEQYYSAHDRLDRARAALRLARLSLILQDGDGAEYWKRSCEVEGVSDCR